MSPTLQPTKPRALMSRLSIMMLLEYMTYGSWWATLGLVMTTNGMASSVGTAYALAAIAALVSMMFTGAIADRFFSSQKVLGVLHLIGGVLLLTISPAVTSGNATLVLVAIFVYMLFFQPTLAMTNNITFTHLAEGSRKFAYIRAVGTAGWIIVGLIIGQSGLSASTAIFTIGAVLSFALAAFSFTLPKTPPPSREKGFRIGDVIGAGAFYLLKSRSMIVLVVCLILAAIPISIYNSFGATYLDLAGVPNVASFMTIGQAFELATLVLIPVLLRKVSIKWVLVAGLIAWVVRAALFLVMSDGNITIAVIVVGLHGICNDFFVMAASIFINEVTRPETRAQAQAMFLVVSFGIGNTIGSLTAGALFNQFVGASTDLAAWNPIWYVMGGLMVVASLLMVLYFRPRADEYASDATKNIVAVRNETRAPQLDHSA